MKKEIHTRASGTFCIGHVNDHNAVEIFFDDLRGENNYLQLRKKGVNYTPIPIPLNSWIPTNTYTSNDDGSPFSYEAQILEKVDGKYIAHSNVFKMYFSESLGADTLDKEDVPPVFKSLLEQGIENLNNAKADAESAKQSAESAYMAFQRSMESSWESKKYAELAESKVKTVDLAMQSVPKLRVEGNPIVLNDTVEQKVSDVLPYIPQPVVFAEGSTTQDGVPNPENSIEIKNGTFSKIISAQKNIMKLSQKGLTEKNGIFEFDENVDISQLRQNPMLVDYSGTLTLSYMIKGSEGMNPRYEIIDKKGKVLQGTSVQLGDFQKKTITSTNGIAQIKMNYSGGGNYIAIKNWQLEYHSVATEYEPFMGQIIPLSKPIKLAKFDTIEIHNNVVEKVNRNLRYYFTGNENWIFNKQLDGNYRVGFSANEIGLKTYGQQEKYCSHFPYSPNIYAEAPVNSLCENGNQPENQQFIIFKQNYFSTIEGWKEWVKNGVYIECEKSEPTFEPLPAEDQNAILNMIIQSPNSTIMTDTGITLSINYIADTKKWVLKQIKELNEKVLQTQKALLK